MKVVITETAPPLCTLGCLKPGTVFRLGQSDCMMVLRNEPGAPAQKGVLCCYLGDGETRRIDREDLVEPYPDAVMHPMHPRIP